MIIQKLRLEKGWSQQQLAEMSGLSTRTIQRIEGGKKASVESVKSLSAVFDVEYSILNGALTMNSSDITPQDLGSTLREDTESFHNKSTDFTLSTQEKMAYKKVRDIKGFYIRLITFCIVMTLLLIINIVFSPHVWWVQWVFLGWGAGIVLRAVRVFGLFNPFSADWEKRQVDKYLNKKD